MPKKNHDPPPPPPPPCLINQKSSDPPLSISNFFMTPPYRGEAEVNSRGRGDNKLAIPEYTVYKYFIIPINIRLIVE